MIERSRDQQAVDRAQAECNDVGSALPVEVGIAVHYAFGPIGRARGVHQTEQIIGRRGVHRGTRLRRGGQPSAVPLRRRLNTHYLPQVDGRGSKLLIAQQQASSGVVNDIADLFSGETIVKRQRHGAEMANGEGQLEKRGAILH